MFVAKGFGAMFAVLVLGGILLDSGFQSALDGPAYQYSS